MMVRQPVNPQAFRYPRSGSSRSSYPSFIPFQDTIALQLSWAAQGLHDAFRWNLVIVTIAGDAEIRSNVYKSLLLNSISLASIYTFDLLLFPLVRDQRKYRNVGWFYQILWLLPVVGVSFYLNSTWCSVIAQRTYTLQRGRRSGEPLQSVIYTGILKAIATSVYRIVMVFTSLAVSFALQNFPYAGPVASFIFLCWLDSYYCFEFVWQSQGLSLSRRVRYLEERWAYFFAFGLPSAALCMWSSGLANATLFALVFPLYVIMAMHARPVPLDPYNPVQPTNGSDVIHHPSPYIPIRLPIFALILWLNDSIIWVLNVASRGGAKSSGNSARGRHRLQLSDTVQSAEEGQDMEIHSSSGPWKSSRTGGHSIRRGLERRKVY